MEDKSSHKTPYQKTFCTIKIMHCFQNMYLLSFVSHIIFNVRSYCGKKHTGNKSKV